MHTHGKVAVVTGAGTGIGKAVAQILLRNNYAVTLTGRRQELLEQTAVDSGADPEKIYCVRADIRYEKDVNQIFDGTVDRFGRIDLLFNNAGVGARAVDIDELEIDEWRAVLETNIHGAVMCARRAFAQMKRQSPMGEELLITDRSRLMRPGLTASPTR